jgi:putative transposase
MARIARLVVPGIPHHVTQRGNRHETTFFTDADYHLYRALLAEAAAKAGTEVWAYCLMPNHVHLILTPRDADGLRRTLADLHRRYTAHVNARNHWTGHLWQGRFGSAAMDESHLLAAARYVALNPVRARLVERAADWPWSSVRAHLAGRDDGVVRVAPLLERVSDFAAFLGQPFDETAAFAPLRRAETIGRPLGTAAWVGRLEQQFDRPLAAQKRGPKPQEHAVARSGDLFSKLSCMDGPCVARRI